MNIKVYKAIIIPMIFSLSLLFSCGGSVVQNPTIITYPPSASQRAAIQPEYRINVGDTLDIKFFYNPDLNEEITVRPDGRVSLQLAHEIMAAGLTPAELTQILKEKYSTEIEKPEITVIVRSFSAQRVFVDGEVNRPGMIELIRPLTVMQSISHVGGLKDTARVREVIVIRRDTAKKVVVIPVDLEKAIDGTNLQQDIYLEPFDIVFVPRSPIANLNKWIDQYIRQNIPIPVGAGYSLD